jgi:hypothetical protein
MELIIFYFLFAATTGIWATYELFNPILEELKILNPEDLLVQNRWLSLMTMACIATLFAPLFIGIVLTPGLSASFKETMLDMVTTQPEKI